MRNYTVIGGEKGRGKMICKMFGAFWVGYAVWDEHTGILGAWHMSRQFAYDALGRDVIVNKEFRAAFDRVDPANVTVFFLDSEDLAKATVQFNELVAAANGDSDDTDLDGSW